MESRIPLVVFEILCPLEVLHVLRSVVIGKNEFQCFNLIPIYSGKDCVLEVLYSHEGGVAESYNVIYDVVAAKVGSPIEYFEVHD